MGNKKGKKRNKSNVQIQNFTQIKEDRQSENANGETSTNASKALSQKSVQEPAVPQEETSSSQIIGENSIPKIEEAANPSENIPCTREERAADTSNTTTSISPEEHIQNVENWVCENLSGSNVGELLTILNSIQLDEVWQTDITTLYDVTMQLNLELLNMFDNYLCFAGPEDKDQFKRLTKMATSRAESNLKARIRNKIFEERGVFDKICNKLYKFYEKENTKISNIESSQAGEVGHQIFEGYCMQIHKYWQDKSCDIDKIQTSLLKYCISIMDSTLDFSAKMNHVHAAATDRLEQKIRTKFLELKTNPGSKKAIVSVPSSNTSPVTEDSKVNAVNDVLLNYKTHLDSKWEYLSSTQTLLETHNQILLVVTKSLKESEQSQLKQEIERYFMHIMNLFEAKTKGNKLNPKCLCVSFTDKGIQFGITTKNKRPFIQEQSMNDAWFSDSSKFSIARPTDISKHIQSFSSKKPKSKERKKVIDVFDKVKKKAGIQVGGRVDQVIMLVPTWYSLIDLVTLRDILIDENEFQKLYFVRESVALIFACCDNAPTLDTFAVITVTDSRIFVEIYHVNCQQKSIVLVAEAKHVPQQQSTEGTHNSPVYVPLASKNLKTNSSVQEQLLKLLTETFERTEKKIGSTLVQAKMGCFCLSSSTTWNSILDVFLKKKTNALERLQLPSQKKWGETLISISNLESNLTSVFIDHTFSPLVAKQTTKIPSSAEEVCDHPSAKTSSKAESLQETCKLIRNQLDEGHVRLGVLMIKLVRHAVDEAESIAKDFTSTEEEIAEQSEKVKNIIVQHKFDIPVQ